ncbi:gliding motility-associated C-terminal domain-containing protein [Polluticoccus soli]|uniref:T9SS type B sorting domain-containing protein n=1 Tax=Polluticoccus soli TaxID=3034150 RepID=UPI0023E2EBE9|nr:gliding motility-associated C-terminal domain-containing protein [Flavipsychrobacter sp. JY13-12]
MREKFTLLAVVLLAFLSNVHAQTVSCPPNIGFENGNFTNWQLFTGTCCPIVANNLTGALANRHVLTSGSAVDPYGGFTVVAPSSGVYSLKLGNSNTGSQAERARYYVHVPNNVNNYSIIFRYAVVFENPNHTAAEQPRFEVRAYDSTSNNAILPCSQFSYVATASLPGFTLSSVGKDVWYKGWTTSSIDLSDYGGKTIAVDFASGDCDNGGHFGYGYVDLTCGLFATSTTVCNSNSTFNITGPYGFQKYEWRDSALTTIIDTNQTGTIPTPPTSRQYALIVTPFAGFGCPDTIYTTVTVSKVVATINNSDTTICNGTTLQLNTTNSVAPGPITYSWAPAAGLSCTTCANPVVTLPVNTKYVVTGTNADNCTWKDTVSIRSSNPTVTTTPQNATYYGAVNGGATATAGNGILPFTYSWNTTPVKTTAAITGLAAGTYTVTITDSLNCVKSAAVTVTQPPPLVVSFTQTNVSCYNGNNGSATATASGGVPPYTYSWNTTPVKTTTTITGLTAGIYKVTVTDANSYSIVDSVTITQPLALAGNVSKTNISCFGGSNGTATANPSGGTSPYTYSWNTTPVKTTQSITGLVPGTYKVTITDANSCTRLDSVIITQPTKITTNMNSSNNNCNNNGNGVAGVTANGGTPPYTYAWNTTPVKTNANINGLLPGWYTVVVTDANGCTAVDSAPVAQPPNMQLTTSQTNVKCKGGSDGTATVVAGKSGNYTYSWSSTPVQTTTTATGLPVGKYVITVEDNNGCKNKDSVIITEPATLFVINASKTDVLCYGTSTGTATVVGSGGNTPYVYSWNTTPVKTTATATNLAAGSYTITATDSNGCVKTASVTISQPTVLSASAVKTDASCFGGSNGTATVTAAGGTAPYTYSWNSSPVQTTATATGLPAGNYTVTVTDANNCTTTASVTIGQPTQLTASVVNTNVSCYGGSNGAAIVTAGGGTTPYSYSWNSTPVQTSAVAINLPAGTYTVTVTDFKGCTKTGTATITQPAQLTASASKTDVSCFNGSNGTATATPTGGTAPYTYSWNTTPVKTTATITGLTAGSYTATVTDFNGCVTTVNATITQPTQLTATTAKTDVSCYSGANGTATVTPVGGTSPYTYSWNTTPVQTTATATALAAGTYTATVTDALGCITTANATVTQPTLLTASATNTNVSCNGGSNGTATVTPAGGTSPYTYSWNTTPTQISATATGLTAGTYTATVTDAKGCISTANATITQPAVLTVSATNTNVSCNGGANGTATATPAGGTTPYSYSWSTAPAQTTATATGLAAGTYTVTVTDSKSCVATTTATITQPTVLSATATNTNVNCNGGANGTATVTPAGGTTPYTYSWNTTPAQTAAIATSLSAGTYTATVTDAKGCTTTASATVTQPAVLTVSATNTNVSCFGGNNGTATATVGGGTTPYAYNWNSAPVQTTSTANNLPAGTYTVTITDAKNCVATTTATVTQPTVLNATATNTSVNCNGGSNGTATVVPTGGTAPYTYSWNSSPVQTTATATNLPAGTYTATVTDALGCIKTVNTTITQPLVLTASATNTNVNCNGGSNGTATAVPVGGTTPYSYSWNTTPAQTTITATSLAAGTYTVTITDAKGCTTTANATVTQPSTLTATATNTNVNCNGGSNGTATVTPAGGTTAYTYSWNTTPAQTTAIATNLPAGTYTATVTDAKGCITTASATVTQPAVLTVSATNTNVSCNGGSNGTATATVAGGTTPYTYSWNSTPVQTTTTANNLTAGVYTVTITDAKNCVATTTATITQPTVLTAATTNTSVSCNAGTNGTATVTPTGGTAPYTYSWNTTPTQTNATATSLAAGTYTATVTDAKGCITTANATITQPTSLTVSVVNTNVSCNGGSDGAIIATAGGGTTPYSYSWNSTPVQTTAVAVNLPAGNYTITVTDFKGCIKTASATVTQPTQLTATTSKTDVSCYNGSNGTATVAPTGGTAPYTYSWNTTPAQTTATATNLPAGTYTATVTDSKGCTTTASATVTQPTQLTATATKTNVSCYAGTNGTATVTAAGGTTPYTYSWNTTPIKTTAAVTGLAAGSYTVTVTDNLGCITTTSVTITQPAVLSVSATNTNVSCNGGSNGTATATPTGGTTPYTYSWSTTPTQTTATATGLAAGTYTITVTDSQNCVATTIATVTQPTVLTATASKTNVSCFNGSNGTATVTPAGGTTPYTYSWNTTPVQATALATNLPAGTYTATVTDAKGCVTTASATVTEPTQLAASATKTDVSCFNGTNGSAAVTASGGTTPYTYSWNTTPIKTTAIASNLAAGTYTATVTDALGCTTTVTTTVIQPTLLTASATNTNVSCSGGSNGTATVTPSGGTAPYTYSWNTTPVQTTATATNLAAAGTYVATVTDALGCITTATVTVTQPTPLAASAVKTDVSCFSGSNGTTTVTGSGGTPPYSYNWNTTPVQNTAIATGLTAGTYTATVTDNMGCTATATITVSQPTLLTASATNTIVSCNSGSNGTATVTGAGGTTPYTYSWNTTPVQTTATATGLIAGTYTATVTDALGCSTTATTTVSEPAVLNVSATNTNVSCYGGSNASATATVTGGTTPYSYSWNSTPGQSASTATNLPAGNFIVTVTDSKGCVDKDTVTITQPTALTASATNTNVSCNGLSDGTVTLTVGGGETPYTYLWNGNSSWTTKDLNSVPAGTYTVLVTDSNGCTITASATVTQPAVLTVATTKSDVLCFAGNTGSTNAVATGGTAPYSYAWNTTPVQNTANATGLTAGTYTVTVTDDHGCVTTKSITVGEPTALVTASTQVDVSCNGGSDGAAVIFVNGGSTPYSYSWNTTPVKTTQIIYTLVAGTYVSTITDAHGCKKIDTIVITQPAPLPAMASSTNVSCFGGNNGTASVVASGGTLPYNYSWNSTPVKTTANVSGLTAGTYTATVTDAKGCISTATVTVTQPNLLVATATKTNASCNGFTNGSATVTVTGGTTPYVYSWNTTPVQTTTTASNLGAGTYTLTVTDSQNCVATTTATVTEPTPLTAAIAKTDVSCYQGNNGVATVTAAGGTAPYNYSWNTTPVQSTATANGLIAGNYTATVTDAQGCITSVSVTITEPQLLVATATNTNVSCHGGTNGTALVATTGGTTPYSYSWNTTPVKTTALATNLAAGKYTATVTDAKGCTDTATVTVTEPAVLSVTTVKTNVSCFNGTNGTATATATGGTTPYSYSWSSSPVQTSAGATGLPAGTYTITVTDANNCVATATAIITQPTQLTASVSKTDVSCFTGSDGTATVTAGGGTVPYTYSWNTTPVQTTTTATGLIAGVYTATVTDAQGCAATATITVTQPPLLTASATHNNVSCFGGNNGTAAVIAGGGTTPYSYSWSTTPVKTTAIATGLVAGGYSITVTDAKGCKAKDTVTITQPPALVVSTAKSDVSCFGGTNGVATVTATGGATPYTYSWNSTPVQTTTMATGLAAGTYIVTVADANNCVTTATAIITQPTQLTATATAKNVSCFGLTDAYAIVVGAGGTAPYIYSWNTTPVQINDTAFNLAAGTYQATVSDYLSCTTVVSVTITQPTQLAHTMVKTDVSCFGGSNGTATVTLTGGTTPYSYSWNTSPVQTTPKASNLIIGTYKVQLKDANNCQDSASVVINEPPLLTATTSKIDELCYNGTTAFAVVYPAGGTPPYAYNWNVTPIQTTDTAKNLAAGAYQVAVIDAHGCIVTAITDTIKQPRALWTKMTADKMTCSGDNSGWATVYPNGGIYPYTVQWHTNPVQTTFKATKLSAGMQYVTVTDSNGCQISDSISIGEFVSPVVTTGPDATVCLGDTTTITANGAKKYWWSPGLGLSCTSCQSPVANPIITTQYRVVGTDSNQCTDTTFINVGVIQHAEVSVGSPIVDVCIGDSVRLSAHGGVAYNWYPSTSVSDSTLSNPRSYTDTPTVYTVVITENECFKDTLTQAVVLHERPTIDLGADTRGMPGATIRLEAKTTNTNRIKWEPEVGLDCYFCHDPVATLSKSITYVATAISSVCEVKDSINIHVGCDEGLFYMPNTFTPNNDGQNDRFWPIAVGVNKVDKFMIYSRWGELVFQAYNIPTNDPAFGWDGRHKQMDVQPDAFIYYMETKCGNGETIFIKGDVSVVR